jgi:hypothetical protein
MHDIDTPLELADLDLELVAAGKRWWYPFGGSNSAYSDTRSVSFSIAGFSFRRTVSSLTPGYGPGFGYRGWW